MKSSHDDSNPESHALQLKTPTPQLPPRHHRRRCAHQKVCDAQIQTAFRRANGYLHIGHAKPSASTLALRTSLAARPTSASTTRTLRRKSRSTSIRSRRTCAGWASIGSALLRLRLLRPALRVALKLVKEGKLRRRPHGRRNPHHEAPSPSRQGQPYRNRTIDENLTFLSA